VNDSGRKSYVLTKKMMRKSPSADEALVINRQRKTSAGRNLLVKWAQPVAKVAVGRSIQAGR
jgi:hypothetical protein